MINDATYVVDCGDGVARQLVLAGVPLTRLVTEQMWIDAARKHFDGTIVVGKDLREI